MPPKIHRAYGQTRGKLRLGNQLDERASRNMPTIKADQDLPQCPVRLPSAPPSDALLSPALPHLLGLSHDGTHMGKSYGPCSHDAARMIFSVANLQHQSLCSFGSVSAHRPLFHQAASVRAAALFVAAEVDARNIKSSARASLVPRPVPPPHIALFLSPVTIRDRSASIDFFAK
ncbi:hypothetical protein FKP32DRAFT_659883 [Trametes sanguinea]|nr:hypothetical protein FKP32DRAFT_659883 [Trametes sanguinea]